MLMAHADYCSIASLPLDDLLLPNLRLCRRKRCECSHYYCDEEARETLADEGYGFEVDRWDVGVD